MGPKLLYPASKQLLLLSGVLVLVYGNALFNGFTLDDNYYIAGNSQIVHAPWRILIEPHENSNVYRPVTHLSYSLNYYTSGLAPWGFHFTNILLHLGVTLLLFALLARFFPEPVAMAACWLFAVLPIHTEAVTSAVGRSELLAALFLLSAWILHLRDKEAPALGCFLLAMMSKESTAVLPALLVLGDYAADRLRPIARYVRSAAVAAAYLGWLWYMQGGRFGRPLIPKIDNPLAELPAFWRVVNALGVAGKYLALQVYPARLSADYSYNAIPVTYDWFLPLLAAVCVAGLWLWAIWRRRSGLMLGIGIYIICFATTANILIPTGTILGERLAYLPSAGFCLLAALAITRLPARVSTGVLAVVICAMSVRTIVRNRDWKDDFTLFRAALDAVPDSVKVRNNYGGLLVSRGDAQGARVQYETAMKIDADYPDLLASYGLLEYRAGNRAVAEQMMERALGMSGRDNPNYDLMATNWAAVLVSTGRADAALPILNKVIAASPNYSRALANRAVSEYHRGERDPARADARRALAADPDNKQAQTVLRLLP